MLLHGLCTFEFGVNEEHIAVDLLDEVFCLDDKGIGGAIMKAVLSIPHLPQTCIVGGAVGTQKPCRVHVKHPTMPNDNMLYMIIRSARPWLPLLPGSSKMPVSIGITHH